MKLKHRLDAKRILIAAYVVVFAAYIIIGLQPAQAIQNVIGQIRIDSINLTSDVTEIQIENGVLNTPNFIAGDYMKSNNKHFIIGHSTTVFKDLNQVKLGDYIFYNNKSYKVTRIDLLRKSDVSMRKMLQPEPKDTLMLMTCAGKLLEGQDATHRLIVTATEY